MDANPRARRYRAVLDCLATQDNPVMPGCAGCVGERLCKRIRGVLRADLAAGQKVAAWINTLMAKGGKR